MQDITYNSRELCLKDLSQEIASQLRRRLGCDKVAMRHACQSFGITWTRDNRRIDIFSLFPDTPVKLLKDVFEALQLYDLVDLLEEKKPQYRSLQIALPLQEVEKLKKGADWRPTTYHTSAAVLIIADPLNNSYSEGIRDFFKGLNAKSDITIIEYHAYDQQEVESVKSAASTVIERWIDNQGHFSLFAVFLHTSTTSLYTWMPGIILRLVSGIPDKIKLVISPFLRMERKLPETLLLASSLSPVFLPLSLLQLNVGESILRLMREILNKRWRKLDLISMVEELNRSLNQKLYMINNEYFKLTMNDNLTSLPRFKKEEDITD